MPASSDPTSPGSATTAGGMGPVPLSSSSVSTKPPNEELRKTDSDEHPQSRPGAAWGMIAVSAVLSLACGAAGAWAYERFENSRKTTTAVNEQTPEAAVRPSSPPTVVVDQLKDLRDGVEAERDRLKQLEDLVAALPKEPATELLHDLETQVKDLRKASQAVNSDEKRLDALSDRVDALDKGAPKTQLELGQLQAKVDALQSRLDEARFPAENARVSGRSTNTASHREPLPPVASVDLDPDSAYLTEGVRPFEQRKYGEALKVFERLQTTHPDDARVWYFSALARGFSTNDWRGETERLVEHGIERERLGTPNRTRIDATLAFLKKEHGKDWLDAYRQRVHQNPEYP
jgi:TolA-binding protein